MRRIATLLISALAGVTGLITVPETAANAATGLPLSGFYQIIADNAHGHLFLSQGTAGKIVVTNLSGSQVATIGQDGTEGMALSPDDTTLYAAVPNANAVIAISTTTLQQTALYPVASPHSVAVQDGKLWVSYQGGPTAAIGDIDLTAASPALTAQPSMGSWSLAPQLAADPSGGGVLVAAEPTVTPETAASYDVSTTVPTVLVPPTTLNNCENQKDLAVAPGGKEFVLACAAPYNHYRFSTADLSEVGYYPSASYPSAVAIAANGTVAAGIYGWYSPDAYIYHQDGSKALNKYEFGGPTWNLADRGLAWSATGSRLYAVLRKLNTSTYALRVLKRPELTVAKLTLGGARHVVLGKSVTVRGKLTLGVGKPPAGTKITITRTRAGTRTRKFTVSLASDDTYKLTNKPNTLGKYTYTARYAGDASRQPAKKTRVVTIVRRPVALTLHASRGTASFRQRVTVTAHLGTTYSGRRVSIYAQSFGSKARKLLRAGRVNSRGYLSTHYRPAFNTTFSAVFGGDRKYAPKTVRHAVRVRARVSQSIHGYYASTSISGTLYRVYHHTASLKLHIKVTPNKSGECVKALVQIYYKGGWYPDLTTSCGRLSGSSTSYGDFPLSKAAGYQYRIRTDYIRNSKDHKNLGNHSSWLHFEVVN